MRYLGLLALLLIAAPATAGAGCGGDHDAAHDGGDVVQHMFDKADEDGDGLLSQSEYEAAGLQDFGASFEESDLDSDGATSTDEYRELYERHHPAPDGSEA
jgi:hypothetical protein